jgi:hypothetical protein
MYGFPGATDPRLRPERAHQRNCNNRQSGPRIFLSTLFIQSKTDLQLHGKRALVTGPTALISFTIAQGLAKEGAAVIVNGRTGKRIDDALATLVGA